MTPKELDNQSLVKINRWVDFGSEEYRMLDDYPELTKKMLEYGFYSDDHTSPFMLTDALGRVWGRGNEASDRYYSFHFEHGSQKIGLRIVKKADN